MVHSTTFKAGPLAMAAGLAALAVIEDEGLVENAARVGESLRSGLVGLADRFNLIADVRGRGLPHQPGAARAAARGRVRLTCLSVCPGNGGVPAAKIQQWALIWALSSRLSAARGMTCTAGT